MKYDHELIFEAYINMLSEANMPWSQHGIKAAAGAHKKGVSVVSPEEEKRITDDTFYRNIESDIKKDRTIDILDVLSDDFGGIDKAKKVIMNHLGTKNSNMKSSYNPFPEIKNMFYKVPYFRLPDLLLYINIQKNIVDTPIEKKLMNVLFDKLGSIYQQKFEGDPNNIKEIDAVRSFVTKVIKRSYGSEGEKQVLQQVVFGGKSERDKFEHVFITNTKELQGSNWERIKKISHLLFTGESRFNPNESDSDTHMPEKKTPENVSPSLGEPSKDLQDELIKASEKGDVIAQDEISKKIKSRKPASKSPVTKKKSVKKAAPNQEESKSKKKEEPKKEEPKKKKKPVKESYQRFIRVIPF